MYVLTGGMANSVAGRAWSNKYPQGTTEEYVAYWSSVSRLEKEVTQTVSSFIIALLIAFLQAFEKEGKAQVRIAPVQS